MHARSRFSVSGNSEGWTAKIADADVQLAACTCSIIASPSYLKLSMKVDLNRPNVFSFQISMILIGLKYLGCTCVHILYLP